MEDIEKNINYNTMDDIIEYIEKNVIKEELIENKDDQDDQDDQYDQYEAFFKDLYTSSLSTFMSKDLMQEIFRKHLLDKEVALEYRKRIEDTEEAPEYRKRIEDMEDLLVKRYDEAVALVGPELFFQAAELETNVQMIHKVIMRTDDYSHSRDIDNEINFRNNEAPLKILLKPFHQEVSLRKQTAKSKVVKIKLYDKYHKGIVVRDIKDNIYEQSYELQEEADDRTPDDTKPDDRTPELVYPETDEELIKILLLWFLSDSVKLKENSSGFIMKNNWEDYIKTAKLIMNYNEIDMDEVNKICDNNFLVTSEVDIDPSVVDFWDTYVLSTLDNPDLIGCPLDRVNLFDKYLAELSKTFSVEELGLFS